MTETSRYLSMKIGQAPKTGERSTGHINYRILSDVERQNVYLTITGNSGGGWFSSEIVPLSRVEEALDTLTDRSQVMPSKVFRSAFTSKSVNNAGFLAALLRAEGLLAPAPEASYLHVLTKDWPLWKSVILSEQGEPYDPILKGSSKTHEVTEVKPTVDKDTKARGKRKGKNQPASGIRADDVLDSASDRVVEIVEGTENEPIVS